MVHDLHTLTEVDRRFLERFHMDDRGKPIRFSHREHVRLAWEVMRGRELGDGLEIITRLISGIAHEHGEVLRYHETLTLFWGRIVHHAILARPGLGSLDEFTEEFPFLLDKGLPLQHWSAGILWADSARTGWSEPDLR